MRAEKRGRLSAAARLESPISAPNVQVNLGEALDETEKITERPQIADRILDGKAGRETHES